MIFSKNLRLRFNSRVYTTHPFYHGMVGNLSHRLLGLLYKVELEQKADHYGTKYTTKHSRWFLWFWIRKVEKE